jgi:hypothetical protein
MGALLPAAPGAWCPKSCRPELLPRVLALSAPAPSFAPALHRRRPRPRAPSPSSVRALGPQLRPHAPPLSAVRAPAPAAAPERVRPRVTARFVEMGWGRGASSMSLGEPERESGGWGRGWGICWSDEQCPPPILGCGALCRSCWGWR